MANKKRQFRPARYAAAGLLLGVAAGAHAQTADDLFKQGLEASRSGETRSALKYFERAEKKGLDSGALFYNLGVSYYQLGKYTQARSAFERLTDHPKLAPLAYYNLGLVALKTDDRNRALSYFKQARARTRDPKLKALADEQVGKLTKTEYEPTSGWAGAVSMGGGRDDTLQDPADQVATETSDNFIQLVALGTGVITGTPGNGWSMDLSAYTLRYQTFDEFDITAFNGLLARSVSVGDWRLEAGAGAEHTTLGGEPYLQEGKLRLTARLPEAVGVTGYRLRYRYYAIQSLDSAFDPQEGSRHDLDLEARWNIRPARWALMYGLEINDREDLSANGEFTSYSPTRHTVGIRADTDIGRWRWNGLVEYRLSEYDGVNVLADGTRVEREDERVRGVLGVDYRLSRTWQVGTEYSRLENDSNIADNDYDQNRVTIDVTALFGAR